MNKQQSPIVIHFFTIYSYFEFTNTITFNKKKKTGWVLK